MGYGSLVMPLAFTSLSHGNVAFGFFNIESDMLLLDQLFFFADAFCEAVVEMHNSNSQAGLAGWRIEDPDLIGDLHGAIAGTWLVGFIGETYRSWPFPQSQKDFRQNPDGHQNQKLIEAMIDRYGKRETFLLSHNPVDQVTTVGEYAFSNQSFRELIDYIDQGGYPKWKDEQRPVYVSKMLKQIEN